MCVCVVAVLSCKERNVAIVYVHEY
jgi:hypothetical protein